MEGTKIQRDLAKHEVQAVDNYVLEAIADRKLKLAAVKEAANEFGARLSTKKRGKPCRSKLKIILSSSSF